MSLCPVVLLLLLWGGTAPLFFSVKAHDTPTLLDPSYTLQQWTIDEGLPVNTIYDLEHGPDGFLWLATHDGLVRFDGAQFRTFTVSSTPALPSNRFRWLWTSPNGILWIQTDDRRIVRYHNRTFTRMDRAHGLPENYGQLFKTTIDGGVAVGGRNGLLRYDSATEQFVRVAPSAIENEVRTLEPGRDSTLWLGMTTGALVKLRRTQDAWERVDGIALDAPSDAGFAETLFLDPSGTLWMASRNFVYRYNGARLTRVRRSTPSSGTASANGSAVFQLLDRPTRFQRLRDGSVGLSTLLRTIRLTDRGASIHANAPLQWDLRTPTDTWQGIGDDVWRNGTRVMRGGSEATQAIADSTGALWVGTYAHGLIRIARSRFRTFSTEDGLAGRNAYGMHQAQDGTIWIGTTDGVSRLTPDGRLSSVPNTAFPGPNVRSVFQERNGTLWMGTVDGLCRWSNGRCALVKSHREVGHPRAIYQDRDGALWVSTVENGVLRRSPRNPALWRRFTAQDGLPPNATVQRILETSDGALWVATKTQGIARFNGTRFERLSEDKGLPLGHIREIYEAPSGALWLGTEGAGLVRLTVDRNPLRIRTLQRVRTTDGLPGNSIHRILPDDHGRLWMSTNQGIFWVRAEDLRRFAEGRLDHSQVHVLHYDEREGMRNREANGGVQNAGLRAADGTLWFPTQDGIAGINPDDEPATRPAPQPFIEQVVANREVVPRNDEGFVRLTSNQRTFAIRFTAPALNNPDDVVYRYRLDGLDATWMERQGIREAFYTSVPPGRYTFRVVAEREHDSDRAAALQLYVVPRFYEQVTFWMVIAFFTLLATVAFVRYRIVREAERANELEAMVDARTEELAAAKEEAEAAKEEAETASELKSRFLAHVTHDLRTPLTSIIGFAEVLRDETDDPHRRFARLIETSARRSEAMVDSLLQLARLQSNAHTVEVRPLDIRTVVGDVMEMMAHRANGKDPTVHWHVPDAPVCAMANEQAVERIVLNVVGNAVKYSDVGDRVDVRLSRPTAGDAVALVVSDTGPGIDPDFAPHLFEPFARDATDDDGSGLGLAITREFVEQMNGTIGVDSTPDTGTTVTVRLPAAPPNASAASPS